MSEEIGLTINIGGTLKVSMAEDLFDIVLDDFSEICDGPITLDELLNHKENEVLSWSGISSYGECAQLKSFLIDNDLSFIYNSDAKYGYDALMSYWSPGMITTKIFRTDSDRNIIVLADDMRPLMNLCLGLISGEQALPLFINDPDVGGIVAKALKKKGSIKEILKGEYERFFPEIPELPPFKLIG